MKNLFSLMLSAWLLLSITSCAITQSTLPDYDINRFETEIAAFEEFDKRARYSPDAVLFTGSSSIRLWSSLGDDMAPVPVINRGFGGSTLPEVNHYYDRIITNFRPSIIVLYCGENDIWIGRSTGDVLLDYKWFVKKTKKELPNTKLVFLSMKPSPSRWDKWNLYQEGNQKIKDFIDKDSNQYYIEVSDTMMGPDGKPTPEMFVQDMLHMNAIGYEGWTKTVRPLIHELYKR